MSNHPDANNESNIVNNDTTSNSCNLTTLTIPAADVLRLIQAHLTEVGLHETCRTLAKESGVGLAGSSHSNWLSWAVNGNWAAILKALSVLDVGRTHLSKDLTCAVHEMAILELAEIGDLQLAYATYHVMHSELEQALTATRNAMGERMSRSRILEQRLAALGSARAKDPKAPVPNDYYNDSATTSVVATNNASKTKQERRQEIGRQLQRAIPRQPVARLPALIQQAIKWQTHTGELPRIRQWWDDNDENDDNDDNDQDQDGNDASERKAKGGKKRKKRRKEFDLVLGQVQVGQAVVNEGLSAADIPAEPIPVDPYATVKFGKKATAESAVFLPDATGLVTGSSDGLIEIWDADMNYQQLKTDLPYQQTGHEELLGHDNDTAVTALTVSNDGLLLASGSTDGMVKVWKVDTGKCLRQIPAHQDSCVSCIAFSPDASHILTASHDGTSREFGLRTARMLKEFRGHGSYVTFCAYQLLSSSSSSSQLLVVTGSADGTVRLWDGKTSDIVRVLRPISLGSSLTGAGSSIVVDHQADASAEGGSPAVHSVMRLHTPPNTMILVPRGVRAFLVNYSGAVLRIFEDSTSATGKVFVAATVSSSNQWLYAVKEDGVCCVFDVSTGELKQTIADFGAESTSRSRDSATAAEINSILHHPTKSILGAFSNDKGQKRGQMVLWK